MLSIRNLVVIVTFLLISGFLFTKTQGWYFFTTGKEQINFNNPLSNNSSATALFNGQKLKAPEAPKEELASSVLGESSVPKRIEIDLTNQRLYAFEGDKKVFDFAISSGKWFPTPTGEFKIWIKLGAVRMTGGSKLLHTFYDLPNVPYTMFFYNDQNPKWKGFGIHGTYWHNNFGHPMSHGCINMRSSEARDLFYWVEPSTAGIPSVTDGTRVVIYGQTPVS